MSENVRMFALASMLEANNWQFCMNQETGQFAAIRRVPLATNNPKAGEQINGDMVETIVALPGVEAMAFVHFRGIIAVACARRAIEALRDNLTDDMIEAAMSAATTRGNGVFSLMWEAALNVVLAADDAAQVQT